VSGALGMRAAPLSLGLLSQKCPRFRHSNLGITGVDLQGIDSGEIFEPVHSRRAPMIPASTSLRL
jgi:hypothetical protein